MLSLSTGPDVRSAERPEPPTFWTVSRMIAEQGRMGWQKASGYNRRALAEAAIGRYKRVIGDALHSRTDARRAAEVSIAVRVLNCMLDLGRPKSIRIV